MVAAITDGLIIPENITIDQRYRFEQTIKSLRASIMDLQESLLKVQESEEGFYCEETIMQRDTQKWKFLM